MPFSLYSRQCNNKDTVAVSGWMSVNARNYSTGCVRVCACILTADRGQSPLDRDTLLTALVSISGDGCAQALAVTPAVTVAGVCQAIPIEPGHIHLMITHKNIKINTHTHTEPGHISRERSCLEGE